MPGEKHRQFIKHILKTSFKFAMINRLAKRILTWQRDDVSSRFYQKLLLQRLHQRLATLKGIRCNIFVQKMKASAAEAFLRGAVRKMIGPNKAHIGPEVARWRRINRTLSGQVDVIEKLHRSLETRHQKAGVVLVVVLAADLL
jgi:hypothetical protein